MITAFADHGQPSRVSEGPFTLGPFNIGAWLPATGWYQLSHTLNDAPHRDEMKAPLRRNAASERGKQVLNSAYMPLQCTNPTQWAGNLVSILSKKEKGEPRRNGRNGKRISLVDVFYDLKNTISSQNTWCRVRCHKNTVYYNYNYSARFSAKSFDCSIEQETYFARLIRKPDPRKF